MNQEFKSEIRIHFGSSRFKATLRCTLLTFILPRSLVLATMSAEELTAMQAKIEANLRASLLASLETVMSENMSKHFKEQTADIAKMIDSKLNERDRRLDAVVSRLDSLESGASSDVTMDNNNNDKKRRTSLHPSRPHSSPPSSSSPPGNPRAAQEILQRGRQLRMKFPFEMLKDDIISIAKSIVTGSNLIVNGEIKYHAGRSTKSVVLEFPSSVVTKTALDYFKANPITWISPTDSKSYDIIFSFDAPLEERRMGYLLGNMYRAALDTLRGLQVPSGIVPQLSTDRNRGLLKVKIGIRIHVIGSLEVLSDDHVRVVEHYDVSLPDWFSRDALTSIYAATRASADIYE